MKDMHKQHARPLTVVIASCVKTWTDHLSIDVINLLRLIKRHQPSFHTYTSDTEVYDFSA